MKRRAFTLIELIIVMAIISISFVVLVFRFSVIDNIGAQNEVKTFLNDYSYARDMALSSGLTQRIKFEDGGYKIECSVSSDDLEKKVPIKRKLKYVEYLKVSENKNLKNNFLEIEFQETGYVYVNSWKYDFRLDFVSKKDLQKKWTFTIQAVGGYIYENK